MFRAASSSGAVEPQNSHSTRPPPWVNPVFFWLLPRQTATQQGSVTSRRSAPLPPWGREGGAVPPPGEGGGRGEGVEYYTLQSTPISVETLVGQSDSTDDLNH